MTGKCVDMSGEGPVVGEGPTISGEGPIVALRGL